MWSFRHKSCNTFSGNFKLERYVVAFIQFSLIQCASDDIYSIGDKSVSLTHKDINQNSSCYQNVPPGSLSSNFG